jgi:hypothetical protein
LCYRIGERGLALELGNKSALGYSYYNWGLLARAQGEHKVATEKLEHALAIFTELNMPRQRDAVQAELNKRDGGDFTVKGGLAGAAKRE